MTRSRGPISSSAPLTDAIIVAVSKLVDDSQTETREPSHSDIEFQINRAGLQGGDPRALGQVVGKAKRVRATLSWAMEHAPEKGQLFVANLISLIRGCGGFRVTSTNFVGEEGLQTTVEAFRSEGYELTPEGELRPRLLDGLSGVALTEALKGHVRRAKRGSDDAALVTGTGKDLLEATAAHILNERWGGYPEKANFPGLLGQAFVALGLATPEDKRQQGEARPMHTLEKALYEIACAINFVRNKEGTGHGRPWPPDLEDYEGRLAVELMGVISEFMLEVHGRNK